MIIAYTDGNDTDFCVDFKDESKADLVRMAIQCGVDTWYEAAHEDIQANDFFTEEEIKAFYESAYSEPTSEILDKLGVEYEIWDLMVDDDFNIICDELIRG